MYSINGKNHRSHYHKCYNGLTVSAIEEVISCLRWFCQFHPYGTLIWRMVAVSMEAFVLLPTGMMEGNTLFQEGRELTRWQEDREAGDGEGRVRPPRKDYPSVVYWGTIITSVRKRIVWWFCSSSIKLFCYRVCLYETQLNNSRTGNCDW